MVVLYDGNADVWMKLEFDNKDTVQAFVKKSFEYGVGIAYKTTNNPEKLTPADVGLTSRPPDGIKWEGEPKTITMQQVDRIASSDDIIDLQIEYGVDEEEEENAEA
jgi:hypothetical protein